MNQALSPSSFNMPIALLRRTSIRPRRRTRTSWTRHEETGRIRRLHSLLALFALYASALVIVLMVSEGADIGCLLGGIAAHVLYATRRVTRTWRDAAALEQAKARVVARIRRLRMA